MHYARPSTAVGWISLLWQMATNQPPSGPFTCSRTAQATKAMRAVMVSPSGPVKASGSAGGVAPLSRRLRPVIMSHAADAAVYASWRHDQGRIEPLTADDLNRAQDEAAGAIAMATKDAERFRELYITETGRSDQLQAELKRQLLICDQQRVIIGNERQRANTAEQALKACLRSNATLRGRGN